MGCQVKPHTATEHARLFNADLRRWPEVLAPGSVVLSHVDGPYDLRKADWDCLTDARKSYAGIPGEADRAVRAYLDLLEMLGDRRGADLVAWYAPMLHTISEASAASASAPGLQAQPVPSPRERWTRAGTPPTPPR